MSLGEWTMYLILKAVDLFPEASLSGDKRRMFVTISMQLVSLNSGHSIYLLVATGGFVYPQLVKAKKKKKKENICITVQN